MSSSYATDDLPVIMAIVNRTPDSFYDKGATFTDTAALDRVATVINEGAGIIDIGGVKAGPGDYVSAQEEIDRVVPTIRAVHEKFPDIAISVDTWRADVAHQAIQAGATLVNDTW
ncbi:MAG: dihydropteroate synthase, partial [Corynebacterium sp.]|nr:dihydropteroate synthase [Corynebacterium sp.]